MKIESIGEEIKQCNAGIKRKPLRSYSEMAEYVHKKYGIKPGQLRQFMGRPDAPKYLYQKRKTNSRGQNSWYVPAEFVAWIKKVIADDVSKA